METLLASGKEHQPQILWHETEDQHQLIPLLTAWWQEHLASVKIPSAESTSSIHPLPCYCTTSFLPHMIKLTLYKLGTFIQILLRSGVCSGTANRPVTVTIAEPNQPQPAWWADSDSSLRMASSQIPFFLYTCDQTFQFSFCSPESPINCPHILLYFSGCNRSSWGYFHWRAMRSCRLTVLLLL